MNFLTLQHHTTLPTATTIWLPPALVPRLSSLTSVRNLDLRMALPPLSDRSLQNRRVWLAPICLCLVACLHLWRVTTVGQTPWKGGGFGMFSTIDVEHARFVRAYLLTVGGERPVMIPQDLEKKVAELRAAPNKQGLEELADRLAQRQWIDARLKQQWLQAQLQQEPASVPLNGERWCGLRNQASSAASTDPKLESAYVTALPARSSQTGIPFTAIRVELCKYEMPAGTSQLQTKRLLTITRNPGEALP